MKVPVIRASRWAVLLVAVCSAMPGGAALAQSSTQQTFDTGSLIIPMDIDYQDDGMLRAFGLLYQLLHAGIPVSWCIATGKTLYTGSTVKPSSPGNSVDFVASATDLASSTAITSHGYRGGPFVVDAGHATQALQVIAAWNTVKPLVAVHQATAPFTATVARQLLNAPNIGINADGNQGIAFGYLNAAGIPDANGNAWSLSSPGVFTPAQLAGPTTTNHADGALFGPTGLPRYCQIMSMHWTVERNAETDEDMAEMRSFLNFPTHLFAECQAVNQIEDASTAHFVTTSNGTAEPTKSVACPGGNGICTSTQPKSYTFLNSDLPFAQLDGPFASVGGSEPGYGWATGSHYYDSGIVMIRNSKVTSNGVDDLWMTSYANSPGLICGIGNGENVGIGGSGSCAQLGKVSYLGGHQYNTSTPISKNPDSQGTRLFLNSLFEAGCVTAEGQPSITLTKSAPSTTSSSLVTFTINYANGGPGIAVAAQITDVLPAGASFVSASNGGTVSGNTVTWNVGDLGPMASGSVTVEVDLQSYGTYQNTANLSFSVGNNTKSATSNTTSTIYEPPPDMAMPPDLAGSACAGKSCPGPMPANPCQEGACDPMTGNCLIVNVADGTACDDGNACTVGTTCTGGTCGGGATVQCPASTNPCQTASCDPVSGCTTTSVSDGTACSTGDQCVTAQMCMSGSCQGGMSVSCPAPLSPCQAAVCDPASGCGFAPANDGAACQTDPCVSGSTCSSGLCTGGTTCPPATAPCTVSLCTASGCSTEFAAAGTDPNGDCPAEGSCARSCDGAGGCTPTCVAPGGACTSDAECTDGMCISNVCGGPPDLSMPADLSTPADLSAPADLSTPADLSAPADLSTPADMASANGADLAGSNAIDMAGSNAIDMAGSNGADLAGANAIDMASANGADLAGASGGDLGGGGPGPNGTGAAGCGCSLGGARPAGGLPTIVLLFGILLLVVRVRRSARED